jgi:hypothetical protein
VAGETIKAGNPRGFSSLDVEAQIFIGLSENSNGALPAPVVAGAPITQQPVAAEPQLPAAPKPQLRKI